MDTEILDPMAAALHIEKLAAHLDPASRKLLLDRARRVLILAQRAGGERSRAVVMDAPTVDADKATMYAHRINCAGSKLRGRTAAPKEERTVVRWPTMAMDGDAFRNAADSLNGYDDAKTFAEQCRKLHRK
jgi:hypothetical protein